MSELVFDAFDDSDLIELTQRCKVVAGLGRNLDVVHARQSLQL
jgi:hypothetical protein